MRLLSINQHGKTVIVQDAQKDVLLITFCL